jgi:type II secretory pathway component PulF
MPFIVTPRQFTQRAELYHQLAQLTSAGIGVVPALEQIKRNPPASSFREPLQHFLDELATGRTLSESLQHGGWLPVFDTALIEAGERSGRLDGCFRLLADYYNDRARVTKTAISQLIYPVGLIHFAVFIFLIVLPFAASQFNASLTWLFVKAALVLAPLYGVVALMIYALQSKHGENWRARLESFLRPIPMLGTARHYLALSRLAAALEALISAGVNVVEAWNLAATASGSPAFRRAVASWKPQLTAGRTPAELVRANPIFPETFANLYASGEVSGKLDETLRRLYTYYQEEGTLKLQTFATWVPRLIYFLIVLVIAYFIISFYQHLYGSGSQLDQAIHGFGN